MSDINCTPGPDNSNRIKTEKAVPTNPENNAKIKYNVPISFALDEKNHLSSQEETTIFFSYKCLKLSKKNIYFFFINKLIYK